MAVLGFIGMGNMGSAMLSGAKETFGILYSIEIPEKKWLSFQKKKRLTIVKATMR